MRVRSWCLWTWPRAWSRLRTSPRRCREARSNGLEHLAANQPRTRQRRQRQHDARSVRFVRFVRSVRFVRLNAAPLHHPPTYAEEDDGGMIVLRRESDEVVIGPIIVNWWKNFGRGKLPDSLHELERAIDPWTKRLAACRLLSIAVWDSLPTPRWAPAARGRLRRRIPSDRW